MSVLAALYMGAEILWFLGWPLAGLHQWSIPIGGTTVKIWCLWVVIPLGLASAWAAARWRHKP
ncbi:MAG: hypothetical protein N3D11_02315 [Candidatus Sumerlaeia bacterium]|nr:hypothetical protein [Candidatus Sumerlaeia bacterium]